jgi:hypothetical protein
MKTFCLRERSEWFVIRGCQNVGILSIFQVVQAEEDLSSSSAILVHCQAASEKGRRPDHEKSRILEIMELTGRDRFRWTDGASDRGVALGELVGKE